MFATTNSCALIGTDAIPVRVEAQVEKGLPRFIIVGLSESDEKETRERVRCGLLAVGADLPLKRVTVNVSPADLPKGGAGFDVPILLAVLAALGELPAEPLARIGAQAELGLDGQVRPVVGTMAGSLVAARQHWTAFITAPAAAPRAAHAPIPVWAPATARELVDMLRGRLEPVAASPDQRLEHADGADLSDLRGQETAVDAITIAAAGGHNVLLYGPPGGGKTMLASRLPGLLPPLAGEEALEVATIHDAAGFDRHAGCLLRPFRAPHHATTVQAMVGGGSSRGMVGEASLAHRGVLFLDELPEFRPSVLDALRQPLEEGSITIRRARWHARYPARLQLVGAMNLCRCGRHGTELGEPCSCTHQSRMSYLSRVSGPIMDRFDLCVRMAPEPVSLDLLQAAPQTGTVSDAVLAARERQHARWGDGRSNADVRVVNLDRLDLEPAARRSIREKTAGVSGRRLRALALVSRTMADLDGRARVTADDVGAVSLMFSSITPEAMD